MPSTRKDKSQNQELHRKQEFLNQLQVLQVWQQEAPEWKVYRAFLQSQAENSQVLGEYRRHFYTHNEDPSFVALRNELFTACKSGMLHSMKILDEVVEALKADIERMKA